MSKTLAQLRAQSQAARAAASSVPPPAPEPPEPEPPPPAPEEPDPDTALVHVPQVHEPGTIEWYSDELDNLVQQRSRIPAKDGQAIGAISRLIAAHAEKIKGLREAAQEKQTTHLSPEERIARLHRLAAELPDELLEIYVSAWCTRHRLPLPGTGSPMTG